MTLRNILTGLWQEDRKTILAVLALYLAVVLVEADDPSLGTVLSTALTIAVYFAIFIGFLFVFAWTVKRIALAFGVSLEGRRSVQALKRFIAARRRKLIGLGERRPQARSRTQFLLGLALGELGSQADDTNALRQSVSAFRESLPALDAAGKTSKWALTQHNLAVSLFHLSRREIGKSSLQACVDAVLAAAEAWRKQDNMADWAKEQSLLCAALTRLGRMEDGRARLADAVAAGRRSLAAEDNSDFPLADAELQINLAEALACLGERETGTEELEEAVAMARQSLKVIVEDKDEVLEDHETVEWPAKQTGNLGMALRLLGERRHDTGLLTETVETLRSAVSMRTEANAYDWAMNQHELACALRALAERVARPDLPSESLAASEAALGVLTRETYPFDWAVATAMRASTLAWLTRDALDRPALHRAAGDLQAAQAVFEQAGAPVHLRRCQADLDSVRALLSQADGTGAETRGPTPAGPIKPRPA